MKLSETLDALRDAAARKLGESGQQVLADTASQLQQSLAERKVPDQGDPLPEFELPDSSTGDMVRSADLLEAGSLVLVFFRGSWCECCRAELQALNQQVEQLQKLGAELVAVSPQLPEHNDSLRKELELRFRILHDAGNEVAARFDLRYELPPAMRDIFRDLEIDLPAFNGDESWTLPMPARFVADQSGTILAVDVNADFSCRSEPAATVQVLTDAFQ
jgi:peroxiredoxin